ncbi:MAG: SDR family NAD(P)-dependent oxidoreductase [Myxococcales bacterium]
MQLRGKRVLVTGGSRGLGLGLVECLLEAEAEVTVIARHPGRLAELAQRLGVTTIAGDIADPELPGRALREVRPAVLVLNAGVTPPMRAIDQISWEDFSATWNTDTRAALQWTQAAIRLPLEKGSRVLLGSSGAAVSGSPLSGGHGGAKRMIWMMAHYANGVAAERGLDLRFQAIVPRQMMGATDHGRACATAYATKKGITVEEFLAGFGKPMSPREFGQHVISILTEPRYESITAFGVKGDTGILSLDG